MVVVTGTKRSGTSMWMQVLRAAGLPVVGEAFPKKWAVSIRDANPRGFFESRLRRGIYYRTNPDPDTGRYLHPRQVRRHAVKVFIPGVVRTDIAFLSRVVATLRPWREYAISLAKLHASEEDHARKTAPDATVAERRVARLRSRRSQLPPAIEWWLENYDLVRDVSVRRYPFKLVGYRRVVQAPEDTVAEVLDWLGVDGLDVAQAAAAVVPELHRNHTAQIDDSVLDVPSHWAQVMDELVRQAETGVVLDAPLLREMNAVNREVEARYHRLSRDRTARPDDADSAEEPPATDG